MTGLCVLCGPLRLCVKNSPRKDAKDRKDAKCEARYFPNTNITKLFGTIPPRGFGRSGVGAGAGPN